MVVRCQNDNDHGASRTRTGDLLGAIQALSQLSYSPERTGIVASARSFPGRSLRPVDYTADGSKVPPARLVPECSGAPPSGSTETSTAL